jgi:hypothetical protein
MVLAHTATAQLHPFGLLYLLTISSICYQQRQKNRRRRPTADEIKGKLGWNFYITLDGGCVARCRCRRRRHAAALFDFPSLTPWSTDLTLAVSASSIIEFHPRINIKQSSANVRGIFAHFLSRESCKLVQKMNAQECEFHDVVYMTEKDLTGDTQIGDLLQIVLETITPML